MNKRQVISVSCVAAIPAAGLLAFLILNALNHGGNMSGVMGAFVAIAALLALLVGIAPFLMMVWYPAEGFASAAPAMAEAPDAAPATDEDEFETDGFDDEFEDDEMSDEFEDGDSFDDEYEDFEDDDDEEWK